MALDPATRPLRDIVRFDRRVQVDDGQGNRRGEWQTLVASHRADISPTRGGEIVVGDRVAGHSVFDVWLRRTPATAQIRPDDRMVQDTGGILRIFDIKFAEAMTTDRDWILMQVEATQGDDGRE